MSSGYGLDSQMFSRGSTSKVWLVGSVGVYQSILCVFCQELNPFIDHVSQLLYQLSYFGWQNKITRKKVISRYNFLFSWVPPDKYRDITLPTASFHVLSDSLFINRSVILSYGQWIDFSPTQTLVFIPDLIILGASPVFRQPVWLPPCHYKYQFPTQLGPVYRSLKGSHHFIHEMGVLQFLISYVTLCLEWWRCCWSKMSVSVVKLLRRIPTNNINVFHVVQDVFRVLISVFSYSVCLMGCNILWI